jgi:hypothetical protein
MVALVRIWSSGGGLLVVGLLVDLLHTTVLPPSPWDGSGGKGRESLPYGSGEKGHGMGAARTLHAPHPWGASALSKALNGAIIQRV